jgi:hypothetical protein
VIGLGLLVLAGIVAFVVMGQRDTGAVREPGGPGLRRTLQYLALLAALGASTFGTSRVLAFVFTRGVLAGSATEELALGLALTLVGIPIWLLLWRSVARGLRSGTDDRASVGWAFYLVAATTGTLIAAVVSLIRLGDVLVGIESFEPGALGVALVAIPVWIGHVRLVRDSAYAPTSAVTGLDVLAGSAIGLIALAVGVGGALSYALDQLYGAVVGQTVAFGPTTDIVWHGLVVAAVAAPVWWWHWLRQGQHATRDVLWHGYVLLIAILGGLATAVVSIGNLLATVLEWLIGNPDAIRWAAHFSEVPTIVTAAIVGISVWWYHQAVLAREIGELRTEPERTYAYLAAGVGLAAAAAGATLAVVAAIQAAVPGTIAASDPGARDALVWAITLLVVGLPVWWVFWNREQRQAHEDVATELRAPSRRIYLILVLGGSTLIAVVSLAVILFVVFRDLLEASLTLDVLSELSVAFGLLLTAGGLAVYHAAVHRDDRALAPVERIVHPRRVLLMSPDGRQLANAVAAETGARVRSLHRLDTPHIDVDAHAVSDAILAVPHPSVLVTIDEDATIRVVPYEPA